MALVSKTFSEIITFTRASTGSYFDSAGVLQSAATNAPRLDYNPSTLAAQGLLIEEQRTNSIRNNTMVGAVAGTPGTAPTNWSSAATTNGLSRQIVGTGTSNGITYIDVRYSGTTTADAFVNFTGPESNNFIAASNGQSWTSSAWIAVVGGSTANLTNLSMRTRFSDSGGAELTQASIDLLTATSTMQRFSIVATASNASTAFAATNFSFQFNNGVAIDITLRIGLPQLELGAFATSVIPTTTAAVTRSADVASVNTLSPWYNATESTLYFEFTPVGMKTVGGTALVSIDNGSNERIALLAASNNGMQNVTTVAGVTSGNSTTPSTIYAANTTYKIALAVKLNDIQSFVGGVAGTVGTTALMPSGLTSLQFNKTYATATSNNGWVRRFTYYPRRLSSAEGIAITA